MSTKAAIEALAAALKRREERFDVHFLGFVVGTAKTWCICNDSADDEGEVLILYYDFKRSDIQSPMNIAVDFEAGTYHTFTEDAEGNIEVDYDRSMSIVTAILSGL